MEMGSHTHSHSDDYMTSADQLHVAQQSRRDKLRGGSSLAHNNNNSDDFPTNFHTHFVPSEMYNFTTNTGSFSSIHPTRFVLPSGSLHNWPQGGGGYDDNYQNTIQTWGNSHVHPNPNPNPPHHHHGLSLSLSSNQISEIRRLGLQQPLEESRTILSSIQDNVWIRNLGPLGPFTGYTTILKGSNKFLRPAQQLLDEFLIAAELKPTTMMRENENSSSNSSTAEFSIGNAGGGGDESYRPDCHQNKAKLINMQEEVCKRQKQYHQEIQLVVSAFESVPGIANATPYILRSLKTLSRHFKCLKNAIADQLRYIKNILGEDLSSPVPSFSRGDYTSLRFGQNFAKVKSSGFGGSGYQSHIWRPQRGLPERAVSILRAWLFDHFLHPYPTDTDKQMLATQTGLSRNQVSNWFINARVRLWKPMVEEIHMLENKGISKNHADLNSNNSGFSSIPILKNNRDLQDYRIQPGFQPKQLESLGGPPSSSMQMQGSSSTMELKETSHRQTTTSGMELDGSFVGFLPSYERRGLDRGGIGIGAAVSLTLGLRPGSETTHRFQQQGMHFGSHVYDAENGEDEF